MGSKENQDQMVGIQVNHDQMEGNQVGCVESDRENFLRVLLGVDEPGADGREISFPADAGARTGENPFEEAAEEDYDGGEDPDPQGLTWEELALILTPFIWQGP